MSNLGMGVMINMLCGADRGSEILKECIGKIISKVYLKDDALFFEFSDGDKIKVYDDGQSCCESRYMRTDDDLAYYAGATLMNITLENAPDVKMEYDTHEVQFLHVKTSKGSFTMSSHNEHNGYYGGFYIVIKREGKGGGR
jgi:hypothetical protein